MYVTGKRTLIWSWCFIYCRAGGIAASPRLREPTFTQNVAEKLTSPFANKYRAERRDVPRRHMTVSGHLDTLQPCRAAQQVEPPAQTLRAGGVPNHQPLERSSAGPESRAAIPRYVHAAAVHVPLDRPDLKGEESSGCWRNGTGIIGAKPHIMNKTDTCPYTVGRSEPQHAYLAQSSHPATTRCGRAPTEPLPFHEPTDAVKAGPAPLYSHQEACLDSGVLSNRFL